jgi:hypothetical protein
MCTNASNIKMTLSTTPNLWPHEERHVVFLDQADVVDVALLLAMNDDAIMNRRGPASFAGQSSLSTFHVY